MLLSNINSLSQPSELLSANSVIVADDRVSVERSGDLESVVVWWKVQSRERENKINAYRNSSYHHPDFSLATLFKVTANASSLKIC